MITLPILFALALAVGCAFGNRFAIRVAPVAALGPLTLAMLPSYPFELPFVLVGVRLAVDAVNQPMLLLAGVAWTLAGWYALGAPPPAAQRFWAWWNLTLAGLTLALVSADIAGFYAGYVMTTLAVYGLVVHEGSVTAQRAGRVYLTMAVAAEMAILYGLLVLAGGEGLPAIAWWLLFCGFAVKVGIVPLHVWLPLAHGIAPTPASAVLSGVIVKAGLLGWLRFLPDAAIDDSWIVPALIGVGVLTAFYGALAGLGQQKLKTVLAYSTVSQMGLVCVGFALVVGGQPTGPLLLFALHHGLNKAALFIGAGIGAGPHRVRMLLMALPAASIAGAPFTTGFLAKGGLKYQLYELGLTGWPLLLVSLSAFTTTLLMGRALWLAARAADPAPLHPAWPTLVVAGVVIPWLWALDTYRSIGIIEALWPIAAAVIVVLVWLRTGRRGPAIPAGDLLALVPTLRAPTLRGIGVRAWIKPRLERWRDRIGRVVARGEDGLMRLPGTGLVLLLVSGAVWWLLG